MNKDAANADGIGGMQHALGTVAEQGAAETVTFVAVTDGQPAQNDDWDRFGHVAAKASRRGGDLDATGRERVIADDLFGFAGRDASAA